MKQRRLISVVAVMALATMTWAASSSEGENRDEDEHLARIVKYHQEYVRSRLEAQRLADERAALQEAVEAPGDQRQALVLDARLIMDALDAARVADDLAHAAFMPSHVFVRLGDWHDTIGWSLRSAQAALELAELDPLALHYAHAMDSAIYAYLQLGADHEAAQLLAEAQDRSYQDSFAVAYALAAMPARYALERRKWDEAAALTPRVIGAIDWASYPEAEAAIHFARGIGAARSGQVVAAQEALEALGRIQRSSAGYWAGQVEIKRLAVAAWLAYADGDYEQALRLMEASAELEDAALKHPVSPGAVLPARELLGDLYLELNRAPEALEAYEASLLSSPKRFNGLLNAGRAAELVGDSHKALTFYAQLLEMVGDSAGDRPGMQEAKAFVDANR